MAELSVAFSSGSFNRSVKRLTTSMDKRFDDYSGIKKEIGRVPTSRSYLNTSGSYLQKKMNNIGNRSEALLKFQRNVESFCDSAKAADRGVASRIKDSSKAAYKVLGIKTGFSAVLHSIGKGFIKVLAYTLCPIGALIIYHKDDIKKWYKDKFLPWYEGGGKYVIAVLVGVVVVVLAVVSCGAALAAVGPALAAATAATATLSTVATGVATLISAGASCFIAYNAIADLFCDTVALSLHINSYDDAAEEWSGKGGKQGFEFIGSIADKVFGTDTFFTDMAGQLHTGLTIASAVWSIGKGAFSTVKLFGDKGFISGLKSLTHIKIGDTDSLKDVLKIQQNLFVTFKSSAEATGYLIFSDYFNTVKGLYDAGKAFNNGDYLTAFGGEFGGKLKKIIDNFPIFIDKAGYQMAAIHDVPNYALKVISSSIVNRLCFNIPAMVKLCG